MSLPNKKFEDLMWLCNQKIWAKSPEGDGPISWAVKGGNYIGAPGKEIYFCLQELDNVQWDKLINKHVIQWPGPCGKNKVTPGNHLGYAACIRYIYGQFEKQGILRSEKDKRRMKKNGVNWDLPRMFIKDLRKKFIEKECYYGMTISCEMEAHRLGDEAVLLNDKNKLNEMLMMYEESVKYANICNSYKQMFTPYYWATKYLIEFGDRKRAYEYSKITIKKAENYCPDSRKSYVDKLIDCANFMKKHNKKKWEVWKEKFSKNVKNRCVKKMFKRL